MNFVYSWGFFAESEYDQYNQTQITMGLSQEKFSYELSPGKEIAGPEVIMTFKKNFMHR